MNGWTFCILILLQVLFGACGKGGTEPSGGGDDPGEIVPGPFTLTVATCNVLKPSGRRSEMSMDMVQVRRCLAQSIKATEADIIGFNELDETHITGAKYSLQTACATLKGFVWKLEWPNDIHADYSVEYSYANGFAYNGNKVQLEESGYVWLSRDTENKWYVKPESAYLNAGSPERTCLWAKFTHKKSQTVFWLFVTHLPTDSQGGADNMAGVVNAFAAQKAGNAPAILTGDMNSNPSSDAYKTLTSYWTDGNAGASWGTLSGSSKKYYYTVDAFSEGRPDRRIDHILTRGCTATDYRRVIEKYSVDGQAWCPSDHLPVAATITIN